MTELQLVSVAAKYDVHISIRQKNERLTPIHLHFLSLTLCLLKITILAAPAKNNLLLRDSIFSKLLSLVENLVLQFESLTPMYVEMLSLTLLENCLIC